LYQARLLHDEREHGIKNKNGKKNKEGGHLFTLAGHSSGWEYWQCSVCSDFTFHVPMEFGHL